METEPPVELRSDAHSDLQEEIQFSRLLTVVCLVVCAAGLGLLLWALQLKAGILNELPAECWALNLDCLNSRRLNK